MTHLSDHSRRPPARGPQESVDRDANDWFARKRKSMDPTNFRSGGAYIPPAKLRMMQQQVEDKSSEQYQRLEWQQLKKRIMGKVNKINVNNIKEVVYDLFQDNIIRGKGLLARSIIQAQAFSPAYTNVYACLVAVINSKFPHIGELVVRRLIIQFKRSFKRNDKTVASTASKFLAHLVNQQVIHEVLAIEILIVLLETPTDDSVEVAIAFLKECGAKLEELCHKGMIDIYEKLRNVLHENVIDKRVQYMIEVALAIRKDKFKAHPPVIEELDLVEEEDQITHTVTLDDAQDPENILNVFKLDTDFEKNNEMYAAIKEEILGEADDSDEEDEGSEQSEAEDDKGEKTTIIDNTETNLIVFRRTVYLTIQSSLDFQECVHKLLKMEMKPGMEVELCHMILDACCQQRTYERFYGLLGERFCRLKKEYQQHFESIFTDTYDTIHRFDVTKLRIAARYFSHLFYTDAISWNVLGHIRLNEDDTTSAGRVFIKILFQELAEFMGLKDLYGRVSDPTLQSAFDGLFPRDNPRDTRFAINFFTSIGLGRLTIDLREHLKSGPKKTTLVMPTIPDQALGSSGESEEGSDFSDEGGSDTEQESTDSERERKRRRKERKKSRKEHKKKHKRKKKKHKR